MELKQGLFRIDPKTYHSMPGLSYTGIKEFLRSPAHYKAMLQGGMVETPAMKFGSAYHAYMLENAVFLSQYCVMPAGMVRRGKEYEQWMAQHQGMEILSQEECDRITAMAKVLWEHPQWKVFSPGSEREIALIWYEQELDIWCRTRIDLINTALRVPVDLKTTQDARAVSFLRAAFNHGYHIQAAWTLRGLQAVTGFRHETFVFIAQEKQDPYCVQTYEAQPAFIEYGAKEIDAMLPTYAACLKEDKWPGYVESLQALNPPSWVETETTQEESNVNTDQDSE